jgi:hypothetical protein
MTHITTKRETKFKRAKLRVVDMSGGNLFDSDYAVAIAAECAYQAVADGFAWLSIDQVREPPRWMKEAQLARQVAVHIMATVIGLPQRQVARLQGRQRTNLHFALKTVERRLECPVFAGSYQRMAEDAAARWAAVDQKAWAA